MQADNTVISNTVHTQSSIIPYFFDKLVGKRRKCNFNLKDIYKFD